MNVSRLVASIGGYAVSRSDDGVAFHLYGGFETTLPVGGVPVMLRESSSYPWSGEIGIEVEPEAPTTFDLRLRIPGWARSAMAEVNGAPVPLKPSRLRDDPSAWSSGDLVTLTLPMPRNASTPIRTCGWTSDESR